VPPGWVVGLLDGGDTGESPRSTTVAGVEYGSVSCVETRWWCGWLGASDILLGPEAISAALCGGVGFRSDPGRRFKTVGVDVWFASGSAGCC
jgi:hypothetical protein